MTFDDWMLIKDKSYVPTDDSMQLRLLRECWFSRDAEVAELKKDAIDFHGQVNRLTEWNNNLVSHRDELIAERDEWKARTEFSFGVRDQLSESNLNITKERDQLLIEVAAWRKLNEQADKTVDKAEQERDQLRATAQHEADCAEAYKAEADQLREQVKMLRGVILKQMASENRWPNYSIEALAATEPKP